MQKKIIGITKSGIKETCNWSGPGVCPRHALHNVKKQSKVNTDWLQPDAEKSPSDSVFNSLSEQELRNLSRFGFIEKDNKYFRRAEDSSDSLEEFRLFNSIFDFNEEQLEAIHENGLIVVDNIGYEIDEYGELITHMPNANPVYMNIEKIILASGFTVPEYIDSNINAQSVLDKELEDLYMNGACAIYALALKELNPNLEIAVDIWAINDEEDLIYNHVFCLDPVTGQAYDVRGAFSSPEELMDYKKYDPLSYNLSEEDGMYIDEGYQIWSYDKAKVMSLAGNFTFDYSFNDVDYTKKLIKTFTKRNSYGENVPIVL